MPTATDTIANPAKMIDTDAPKVISDKSNRSCTAMDEYKTVGENRAISISKIDCLNNKFVAGQSLKVRVKPRRLTAPLDQRTIGPDHLQVSPRVINLASLRPRPNSAAFF